MLRAVFSPRWLGALLLSVLFAFTCYHLGHWQYGRYEFKHERAERISTHYDAKPVPVEGVLGAAPMGREHEWTRVTATGSYAAPPLLVANRQLDGTAGFESLAPFVLADGSVLIVDRGWLPNSTGGAAKPPVATTLPSDQVTITGWLRVGETSRHRTYPTGQVASINLADVSAVVGRPVLGGYLQLDTGTDEINVPESSDPATPVAPVGLGRPDTDVGPHLAYAYQWWASMVVGFVLVFLGIRRQLREQEPGGVRPKKTRIWDEEDA